MLHSGDVHGVVQGDEVRLVVHVQDGCLDIADMLALQNETIQLMVVNDLQIES